MFAIISITSVGLVLGLLLALFSNLFPNTLENRVDEINNLLPGANCGGCGFAGCLDYAKTIINDDTATNLCPVGKTELAGKIAKIMGTSAVGIEESIAFIKCSGNKDTTAVKYDYEGLDDCLAAAKMLGGPKVCSYACIGLGNCQKKCKFNAISIVNGLAKVNPKICTACGTCVDVCPKGIITMRPKRRGNAAIACSSILVGRNVTEVCDKGCNGCGVCIKICPVDAITLDNNLPKVDYEKCTNCGACIDKCPRKVIS